MPLIKQKVSFVIAICMIITLSGCKSAYEGIPPAQATIWALETQLAFNNIYMTMTALSITNTPLPSPTPKPLSTPLPPQALQATSIPLPTDTQLPVEHGGTVQVTIKVTQAQLREGPDVEFPLAGDYVMGDTCQVIGQYDGWLLVQCAKGNGWLYLEWVLLPPGLDLSAIPVIARADVPMLCQKNCDGHSEQPDEGNTDSFSTIISDGGILESVDVPSQPPGYIERGYSPRRSIY